MGPGCGWAREPGPEDRRLTGHLTPRNHPSGLGVLFLNVISSHRTLGSEAWGDLADPRSHCMDTRQSGHREDLLGGWGGQPSGGGRGGEEGLASGSVLRWSFQDLPAAGSDAAAVLAQAARSWGHWQSRRLVLDIVTLRCELDTRAERPSGSWVCVMTGTCRILNSPSEKLNTE